ncbi:MAG TPA: succinate dehydrogenase/fumarate reductase flavoprotein subunit, partial [Actinomycetota bacterium]|nr:succinate dehydrogenase/fumarate reductase flavoprotein subunit [Actinomycetota bacterium]
ANIRARLQDVMMDKASVVRTDESLGGALDEIEELRRRYDGARVRDRSKVYNTELIEHLELGFLIDMAEALCVSARARTESRGGHYREDHTMREDDHWLKHSFITRTDDGGTELNYKDVVMGRYEPVERKY